MTILATLNQKGGYRNPQQGRGAIPTIVKQV